MEPKTEYQRQRQGAWKLLVHPQLWNDGLWEEVRRKLEILDPKAHPQTCSFSYPEPLGPGFHLKVYYPSDRLGSLKDLFRDSKAFRALKQAGKLMGAGFHTPVPVAAGEKRQGGFLHQGFFLTLTIEGTLLPYFLRERYAGPPNRDSLGAKREGIRQLAREIGRLHRYGFVHGDLIPYNIVIQEEGKETSFFFIDNDRTRCYPGWFPQGLWKRNLVQLNRFPLSGISPRDRLRFLYVYLGHRSWPEKKRRLIRWLERKTLERGNGLYNSSMT